MTTPTRARRFRLHRPDAAGSAQEGGQSGRGADRVPATGTDGVPAIAPQDAGPRAANPRRGSAAARVAVHHGGAASEPAAAQGAGAGVPAQGGEGKPAGSAGGARKASNTADATASGKSSGGGKGSAPDAGASDGSVDAGGLTARQLRMAMRVAARHGIRASTGVEAALKLKQRGIDPFTRANLLDMDASSGPAADAGAATLPAHGTAPDDSGGGGGTKATGRALTVTKHKVPKARSGEAETAPALPDAAAQTRMQKLAAEREMELAKVQRGIVRRRRRKLLLLAVRLWVFVALPTFLVGYYFYALATPLYATQSEFVIQQADAAMPGAAGALGGMMGAAGLGNSQDSISVQSFLESRGAMQRLSREEGFKTHFQAEDIDILRRLPADATDEAAYRLYKRHVKIGFDPTEGVIRMEVIATTPEASARFAQALISYAEEQVDLMTQRLRENAMQEARASLDDAQANLRSAQMEAVALQERFEVLSSEVELSLLSQQIVALETELTQARLSLQEQMANPRPNPARTEPLRRRIASLEAEIATLRNSMTQGTGESVSLARIQSELVLAEADVQTRQLMLSQSMQQLETARLEANRQVRYLSLSVTPIAPDEATYPRALENTALAAVIFAGIYLMLSMTASILREQVTS